MQSGSSHNRALLPNTNGCRWNNNLSVFALGFLDLRWLLCDYIPLLCLTCMLICSWTCIFVFPSAMPCQTTLTGPCGLREKTSVYSYQAKAEQVKQRPPRRSSCTTLSPAPLMITWLHLVTACYSQTLSWRYLKVRLFKLISLYLQCMILSDLSVIFIWDFLGSVWFYVAFFLLFSLPLSNFLSFFFFLQRHLAMQKH